MRYTNKQSDIQLDGVHDRNFMTKAALQKLQKLEDIEEVIKAPVEYCAEPYYLSDLKQIYYRKRYCDVVRIVIYEEATKPYMEIRCSEFKHLKMLFLEDYKNTWWLTKEEREYLNDHA